MSLLFVALLAAQTQEERITELERKLTEVQAELARLKTPPPQEKPSDVEVEFKDGLKFKHENFNAHIGGRVLTHARFNFDRPDDGTFGDIRPDGFFVRQARLEFSGDFYQQFEFKVQYDAPTAAAADSGTLQDGYLGWKPLPEFNLRFGQFKEPFSQEETTSTRFIDFVDRSIINILAPARDIGIMAWGDLFEQQLRYEAGIFNGAGRGVFNADDETDVAARLQAYPFRSIDDPWAKNLRLGVAGTFGDVDQETAFPDYRSTETTTRWLDVDATVLHKGRRNRLGAEFAWMVGPVGLRSEYITRRTDVREAAVEDTIHDQGWYVAATWLVTGEDKPMEGRIAPAEPFDLEAGGWGAFELAFRYAELEVDDDIFTNGFAAGAANSNAIDSFGAGFNWYLTRNFRYSFDFIHNSFDDGVLIGASRTEDSEDVVLMRFQIDF